MQSRRRSRLPGARHQPAVVPPDGRATGTGRPPAARSTRVSTAQTGHTQTGTATKIAATTSADAEHRRQRSAPASSACGWPPVRARAAARSPRRAGRSVRQHRLARSRAGHGGSSSDASPAPSTPVITASSRAPPNSAHQQRFAQRAAAQPAHVEGVLAHPQQAVLEVQGVAASRRSTRFPYVTSDRSTAQHDRGDQHARQRRRPRWRRHRSAAPRPARTARPANSASAAPAPA